MTISEARQKSRSLRRIQRRIPSGKVVTHYMVRKPSKAQCAACGAVLHGVPRASSSEMHAIPKSQRRPERPYGGKLCSACSREAIVNKYRNIFSLSKK